MKKISLHPSEIRLGFPASLLTHYLLFLSIKVENTKHREVHRLGGFTPILRRCEKYESIL